MPEARTRILLGALAVACVLPSSASASGGGDLPRPAVGIGSEDPPYAALTCGVATFSDPTTLINQDGTMMIGSVTGGPFVVADPETISVTVTCTVQINSPDPGTDDGSGVRRTSRSNTVPGNVGVLADTIGYNRYDGDEVYVCTLVSWSTADGGPQTWEYDADTETGGVQCDRAVTIQL